MDLRQRKLIQRHIATHSIHSAEDRSAVSYLESVLNPGGRINTAFSCDDKWPNHDGTFEYVSNPDISRHPEQNFIVQIKGTHNYKEQNGVISYCLQSLAFPAFVAQEITADPGILFVVLNPDSRNDKRIFWKCLTPAVLNSIDYFCCKLNRIIDNHLFLHKLNDKEVEHEEALRIVYYQCREISNCIEKVSENSEYRDEVSRRIVRDLYDLCYATLILNAYKKGYTVVSEQLAWEISQFNITTKYLSNFLKGLKYIDHRITKDGQAERLMLKYYNYLWEIRKFLKRDFDINVLDNLEKFPLDLDSVDSKYYEMVADQIENTDLTPRNVRVSRYYIQRIIPFKLHIQKLI